MDGKRVVYTLCSPKCRGGLNPSLVKGLVPHLEVVALTYLRDLNPKGLLGLYHPHIIPVLLSLIPGLLNLL